jgi:siderophore synthetase component
MEEELTPMFEDMAVEIAEENVATCESTLLTALSDTQTEIISLINKRIMEESNATKKLFERVSKVLLPTSEQRTTEKID